MMCESANGDDTHTHTDMAVTMTNDKHTTCGGGGDDERTHRAVTVRSTHTQWW